MSAAVLDRGLYFPSPITDWYRERSFKIAFAVSLLIHAALIALVPGFRSVSIEPPKVLNVEILVPERVEVPQRPQPLQPVQRAPQPEPLPEPEVVPPPPVTAPPPPPRSVQESVVRPQPSIEPRPEPVLRPPEPEAPAIARTDVVQPLPRPEPRPEPVVVPRPEPRPEPRVEPRVETRPEPRVEPRPQPEVAPPPTQVVQPRTETPVARPAPPPVPVTVVQSATAPPVPPIPAPTPAPVSVAPNRAPAVEEQMKLVYGQSISREIKRYQKYPLLAQRRGWEGTAEILLRIAADGKVTGITLGKSSGRAVLDEEALNMVRRATPLPEAPQDLRGRELTVTVPIVFKLQES